MKSVEAQQVEYIQKIAELQKDVLDLQVFKDLLFTRNSVVDYFNFQITTSLSTAKRVRSRRSPSSQQTSLPL